MDQLGWLKVGFGAVLAATTAGIQGAEAWQVAAPPARIGAIEDVLDDPAKPSAPATRSNEARLVHRDDHPTPASRRPTAPQPQPTLTPTTAPVWPPPGVPLGIQARATPPVQAVATPAIPPIQSVSMPASAPPARGVSAPPGWGVPTRPSTTRPGFGPIRAGSGRARPGVGVGAGFVRSALGRLGLGRDPVVRRRLP
jgi:hypothetical protein